MVNPRLAETGILKSEPETKKCSDLIEKQICDRQTQNLRIRYPLVHCARFRDLGRICRDFSFFRGPFTTPVSICTNPDTVNNEINYTSRHLGQWCSTSWQTTEHCKCSYALRYKCNNSFFLIYFCMICVQVHTVYTHTCVIFSFSLI